MTSAPLPVDREYKGVPALLEPPPTHRTRTARPPAPASGVTAGDDETGIVEALVAVTGVVDDVNDVIETGAFARTLHARTPAMVLVHRVLVLGGTGQHHLLARHRIKPAEKPD